MPRPSNHLHDALYLHQKKSVDTRARFILGQIYQEQGEYSWATDYYTQVIKKNPPYEMAFNAAINLAKCYDIRYEEDSKKLVKKLSKMLKEDKNKDFLDQIYYALSDIAFKESKDSLAIEYLRLSVATSKSNQYQKVTSALKLGDIYFDIPEYQLSQAYYDTAVQVMPEDYPDYEKIKARTTYLTELVTNLIIVETEDSLQRLVNMTDEERFVIIDKIIEDVIAEEERQKELEELALLTGGSKSPGGVNTIGGPTGSGSWYFYNPQAIKLRVE